MKITHSSSQLEIKSGGVAQVVVGVVMVVAGAVFAIAMLAGAMNSGTGQPAPKWYAVFGLIFVTIGILLVVFAKNTRVILRPGGESLVEAKRILGGGIERQTFSTAQVTAVKLHTYRNQDSTSDNSSGSRQSDLYVQLQDNSQILLGSSSGGPSGAFKINGFNAGSLIQKAPLSREAEEVAAFLGVPMQTEGDVSFSEFVGKIKEAVLPDATSQSPGQPVPMQQTVKPVYPQNISQVPNQNIAPPPVSQGATGFQGSAPTASSQPQPASSPVPQNPQQPRL
jgi:hypothetical protein